MVESKGRAVGEVSAALAPLSRRRFLKTGLLVTAGATAALAGGFALLRRSPRDQVAAPPGLKHLQPAHYHLFARLAEVLLPTAGTALFPFGKVPVVANVDAILGALSRRSGNSWRWVCPSLTTQPCSANGSGLLILRMTKRAPM